MVPRTIEGRLLYYDWLRDHSSYVLTLTSDREWEIIRATILLEAPPNSPILERCKMDRENSNELDGETCIELDTFECSLLQSLGLVPDRDDFASWGT
eukprot:2746824-Amphidinium_carterae.1